MRSLKLLSRRLEQNALVVRKLFQRIEVFPHEAFRPLGIAQSMRGLQKSGARSKIRRVKGERLGIEPHRRLRRQKPRNTSL